MKTIQYTMKQAIDVSEAIRVGRVVAFPTDTVYGMGVRYDDEDALTRLKQAKLRPSSKPIPMMVSSLDQIKAVAHVNAQAQALIDAFMPGALTLVLPIKKSVPAYVNNGLDTIAIRMPDDPFVLDIMKRLGRAMLVSSANISEQHSCTNADEVLMQLEGRIDGIVMGCSGASAASTIVDVSGTDAKILREGMISEAMIDKVLKEDCI